MAEISGAGYYIRLHALNKPNCPMSRRDSPTFSDLSFAHMQHEVSFNELVIGMIQYYLVVSGSKVRGHSDFCQRSSEGGFV
jgi:hypothetical protein